MSCWLTTMYVFAAGPDATLTGPTQGDTGGIEPLPAPDISGMTDILDIKALTALEFGPAFQTWLLLGLAALLVLSIVWLWWRRRARTSQAGPPPPHEIALADLERLAAGQGPDRLFYFQLSAVFRRYLEGRFLLPALEMTAEELRPRARRLELNESLLKEIDGFIVSSDLIKFAGQTVRRNKRDKDLELIRRLVTTTRPESPPEPSGKDSLGGE